MISALSMATSVALVTSTSESSKDANNNIPIEENKDFGTVNNKRLQKQSVLNIEEKEFWTLVNKHTLSTRKQDVWSAPKGKKLLTKRMNY